MKFTTTIATLVSAALASEHCAECDTCAASECHDTHVHAPAPIGVMGAHTHEQGSWMFSYRLMTMQMEDLLQGSNEVSGMGMYPQDMTMNMHMIGTMYAVTDKLTIMAMANYLDSEMTMRMMMNEIEMSTSGWGDVRLAGLYQINPNWIGSLGLSLPTGSITESFINPMNGNDTRAGYNMQLGSGSYEFRPALTYLWNQGAFSGGAQARWVSRLNDNEEDYHWSEESQIQTWVSYQATEAINLSLRLSYLDQEGVEGSDATLNSQNMMMEMMNPGSTTQAISNAANTGRKRTDLGVGARYELPKSIGALHLEYLTPLQEEVNGVQLGTGDSWVFGYTKSW